MKKTLYSAAVALLGIAIAAFSAIPCSADAVPYTNYTYSQESGSITAGPQAYLPERVIYAKDLGLTDLSAASDLFYDECGLLYVLDTGNNRILVLNGDLTLKKVFTVSDDGYTLDGAKGIFADEEKIYVADSKNGRIIVMDRESGKFIRFLNSPKSDVLGKDFIFKPIRLAVDGDGLIYAVSEGTYEGIINLDAEGNFLCFFGSNTVVTSPWDLFWRKFSTKEQRKNMIQLIPQDFSSIDIDSDGFFLATCYTEQNNSMVKRLNPGGSDIIRNMGKTGIVGDPYRVWKGTLDGNSSFVDIASGPDNIYACLDYTRGKIFCYNNDGYLLYSFGTLSDQVGGFSAPVALTYLDRDRIAVLDTENASITVFAPTQYAGTVNSAVHYGKMLDYENALEAWQRVLTMNSNYDLAHNAIGRIYYNQQHYDKAAKEFRAASNKIMYSKAAKELRSQHIYDNIYYFLGAILLLAVLITAFLIFRKGKRHK